MDVHELTLVTKARDRLRRFAHSGGQANPATEIAFSGEWLQKFQQLADYELHVPTSVKATGVRFWGIPVRLDDALGPRAAVKFKDGNTEPVQLDPQ